MRETSVPTLVESKYLQRKPPDVLLHLAAQLGDETLGGLGERLGEGERGQPLHQGGEQHRSHKRHEEAGAMFADHVVNEEFCGCGEHQSGDAIDHHQEESQGEQAAARTDQNPDFRQSFEDRDWGTGVGFGADSTAVRCGVVSKMHTSIVSLPSQNGTAQRVVPAGPTFLSCYMRAVAPRNEMWGILWPDGDAMCPRLKRSESLGHIECDRSAWFFTHG